MQATERGAAAAVADSTEDATEVEKANHKKTTSKAADVGKAAMTTAKAATDYEPVFNVNVQPDITRATEVRVPLGKHSTMASTSSNAPCTACRDYMTAKTRDASNTAAMGKKRDGPPIARLVSCEHVVRTGDAR